MAVVGLQAANIGGERFFRSNVAVTYRRFVENHCIIFVPVVILEALVRPVECLLLLELFLRVICFVRAGEV